MRTLSLASTILATLLAFLATASAHDSHEHIGINNNNNNNQQLVFSLSETSTADSILANHDKIDEQNAHVKKFKSGDTLAYVTPWNNRGYDVVKDFKGKFDYVSPVWYYVERRAADDYEFFGEHDVDHDWMDQVRGEMEDGRKVGKIVPRFQFRNWKLQDYQSFASNNVNEGYILAQRILEQVLEHDFDGIVLECGYPTLFPHFIKNLGIGLHHAGKELVVVIPPIRTEEQKQLLDADMFETLAQVIDKFSIMTYDYSSHIPTGGPSAPVDWIIDNIEWLTNDENANKLLVGLNMYAMAYTETAAPEPMLLKNVLERLPGAELVWDKESEEHWFIDLETRKKIWLPTRKSIKNRLHIAEDYGVGLSLWEVGQGLDYWYDLF